MTNSSPWEKWPIEIDGLPINGMVIFHGYVVNNQMVYDFICLENGCEACVNICMFRLLIGILIV